MLKRDRENYRNRNDDSSKRIIQEMKAEIDELRSHMTRDVPSQVGGGTARSMVSQVTQGPTSIMGGRNEQEHKRQKPKGMTTSRHHGTQSSFCCCKPPRTGRGYDSGKQVRHQCRYLLFRCKLHYPRIHPENRRCLFI